MHSVLKLLGWYSAAIGLGIIGGFFGLYGGQMLGYGLVALGGIGGYEGLYGVIYGSLFGLVLGLPVTVWVSRRVLKKRKALWVTSLVTYCVVWILPPFTALLLMTLYDL